MKELWEFVTKILEWSKDHKAVVVTTVVMILINIFIDTDWSPSWINFYHQGWIEHNRQWVIPLIVLAGASLFVSWHWLGFAVVLLACIGLGVFFALNYAGSASVEGNWPLIVWLAYRSTLALLIGFCARVADFIAKL
jgi:hypothetical protein